ncbi:hypothetical protein K438DRAFT_2071137 [Mycena galopus ATCC 62051]|nr:hypothetical protein K438DRAFT_2071137 [Mycena galopus ATCC 62051]
MSWMYEPPSGTGSACQDVFSGTMSWSFGMLYQWNKKYAGLPSGARDGTMSWIRILRDHVLVIRYALPWNEKCAGLPSGAGDSTMSWMYEPPSGTGSACQDVFSGTMSWSLGMLYRWNNKYAGLPSGAGDGTMSELLSGTGSTCQDVFSDTMSWSFSMTFDKNLVILYKTSQDPTRLQDTAKVLQDRKTAKPEMILTRSLVRLWLGALIVKIEKLVGITGLS